MAETETDTDERDEDDFGLDPRVVEAVQEAVEGGDAGRLDTIFGTLHAADIADLLEQIGAAERQDLIALAPDAIDGDVLSELDEGIREEVIEALPHDVLSEAVRELDSDDVVDLIEDLEEPQQEMILGALPDSDRAAVEQSLTYPEHSAGRLMQREVVTAPEHWTVGEAIDFLRGEAELPDQFYHVILVDPLHHPAGYVKFSDTHVPDQGSHRNQIRTRHPPSYPKRKTGSARGKAGRDAHLPHLRGRLVLSESWRR